MIRIAAVGDIHIGVDSAGKLRPRLENLRDRADVLLIAGDLTNHGSPEETEVLVGEIADIGVPTAVVLGNHDHHCGQQELLRTRMQAAGISVLEGDGAVIDVDGERLGIAGTKGFGGGFVGACGSEFGEDEMKAFIRSTRHLADRLRDGLASLDADWRVALMHYAPVPDTLNGERLEIYPFLGSYLLAEACDEAGADLIVHGHAHAGTEKGATPGGIPVRNVAQHVIGHPYALYCLGEDADDAAVRAGTAVGRAGTAVGLA